VPRAPFWVADGVAAVPLIASAQRDAGLDHVHDHLDKGRRREEFAVVLGALDSELHQKILIDPAEYVAAGGLQGFSVEDLDVSLELARS
jgi:hypothetical protein